MITKSITDQEVIDVKQANELPNQLAELIILGWTEAQIIRLAQMRGKYHSNFDDYTITPSRQMIVEQKRLVFARWLYRSGRLQG
jgi:hypothetical protein